MKPRVYSYIRFSSAEQAGGDSVRRQTDAARRYAAANGFELDEALSLHDLGRSAYAGHHVSEGGALGSFLAACEAGLVPTGSVLVVEAVDRLTRLDHLEAMTLIGRLVKHVGLHVVQLGRTFTDDIIRHDMGAIFTLIGAITLGHQESMQKSHRVGSAWEQKRNAAVTTKLRLTKKAPAWLKPTEKGFEPIPARVKIIRDIFERFIAGESRSSIVKDLNQRGVSVWGRGQQWNRSYIFKILTNEAVVGVLQMGRKRRTDKRRAIVESVENYFPAIIDATLFAEATRRTKTGTKGRIPSQNPFAGVLRCPHCGGTITRDNKGARARAKLVCAAVRDGGGADQCKHVRVDLEDYWEQFKTTIAKRAKKAAAAYHPASIVELEKEAAKAREELETIRQEVAKLHQPSSFLVSQVTKLEVQVQEMEAEIREASRDTNLSWENLRDALEDPSTTPSEMSARLRAVFTKGITLEIKKS
jgi:DNA invertase Pin-like site-specific DNA recombinase